METIPLWLHVSMLVLLLMCSAFFSIAETSMMALNRYRLSHLVAQGRRGAALTASLLGQTEKLLGTILLGNNLVNTGLTAMVTALAIRQFGDNETVLLAATALVAFLLIVFCEITPKVIGATYPDRIALPASFALRALMKLARPAVWFVNRFSGALLWALRVDTKGAQEAKLSPEELRTVVLESGQFMPGKHRSILVNLFDLEHITVDDVMTPRGKVEALNIATSAEDIAEQLATSYHNKLPVYEGELNRVIGMLHVRKALGLMQRGDFGPDDVRELLSPPYFIPEGTPVFTQLQFFQETRQRLGLVVDEYGEVLGLVTLEDIIEEIIGEFTTQAPGGDAAGALEWGEDGQVLLEGTTALREINRRLGTRFPLDGPKTLSGWVLEMLRELPEGNVSLRLDDVGVEVVNLQGRTIRSARLTRLGLQRPSEATDRLRTPRPSDTSAQDTH